MTPMCIPRAAITMTCYLLPIRGSPCSRLDDIGLDDDFFALGGHSLMATRIIARIEEQFGARLSLRDLFEGPSIRLLAQKVVAQAVALKGKDAGRPESGADDEDREEIEF